MPDLERSYSDQKRLREKNMREVMGQVFIKADQAFDFKRLIEIQKAMDKKRMIEEITERVAAFNSHLINLNNVNEDDDDLPDALMLQLPSLNP